MPPRSGPCAYNAPMREIAAREAKNRFGQVIEASQRAPVTITRDGRAASVLMSVRDYDRLRGAAWKRLAWTMDRLGAEATANGLTDAKLAEILADDA